MLFGGSHGGCPMVGGTEQTHDVIRDDRVQDRNVNRELGDCTSEYAGGTSCRKWVLELVSRGSWSSPG